MERGGGEGAPYAIKHEASTASEARGKQAEADLSSAICEQPHLTAVNAAPERNTHHVGRGEGRGESQEKEAVRGDKPAAMVFYQQVLLCVVRKTLECMFLWSNLLFSHLEYLA